jgi:NifU-like protein involved in Fe-S cluster formation
VIEEWIDMRLMLAEDAVKSAISDYKKKNKIPI